MKKIVSLFICCYLATSAYAQIDNRYLVSVIYLNTNKNIADRVNRFFDNVVSERSKSIPFYIDDSVRFIDVKPFIALVKKETLDSEHVLEAENKFSPVKTDFLGQLIPAGEDKLILIFSKIYGNMLAAEVTTSDPSGKIRFGSGYRILFVFDDRGMVSKTYEQAFLYN
jgi:hypothetical protein